MTGASRILGVDPGTLKMGYGVIEALGDNHQALAYGVLQASTKTPLEDRLARLFQELLSVMDLWRPTAVAVEEPYVGGNPRTSLAVGRAQALVLLASSQRGIPVSRHTPAEVKSYVTDYGRGSKSQVQQMMQRLLSIPDPLPPDAADALAVALCHLWSRNPLLEATR